jgi:UDP-glucose 4-epimerase
MRKKYWLITGGCGFIGTSLIGTLLTDRGNSVRVIDNLRVGTRADLGTVAPFMERDANAPHTWTKDVRESAVELVVGDILDSDLALRLAEGMDVIVHLAANTGVAPSVEDPRADCMHNVLGLFNYLEAARLCGCGNFVFASSGAVIGDCDPPLHEELPGRPASPYGASKLAGEAYCSAYFRTFGVKTVALRFSNVYGPLSSHKNSLVARCIRRVMDGEDIEIYGDGENTRDFLYIDDLVRALLLAATSESAAGEVFQIATNEETSVAGLVDLLVPLLQAGGFSNIPVRRLGARPGDVRRNFADTGKAERLLGWKAHTPLREGLERTLNWFLRHKGTTRP